MALVVIGLNFQSAPLQIREQIHFREETLETAYTTLKKEAQTSPLQNAVILATCNRVELYTYSHAGEDSSDVLIKACVSFLTRFHAIKEDVLKPHLYRLHGASAVLHLFQVASGLKSMVLGENQILAQIKKATRFAQDYAFMSSELTRVFQQATAAGKRVRHETQINKGGTSLGSVTLDFIKELYGKNTPLKTTLIGAGEIAREVLKSLIHHTHLKITLVNRNLEKAQSLGSQFHADVLPLDKRYTAIAQSDVIISSVEAEDYIIDTPTLRHALKGTLKPMIFIDLSVPRSLDPRIEDIQDVILYTIDDLQAVIHRTSTKRQEEVQAALEIINTLEEEFYIWETKRSFIKFLQAIETAAPQSPKNLSGQLERLQQHMRDSLSLQSPSPALKNSADDQIDAFLKRHLAKRSTPQQKQDPSKNTEA